MTIRVTPAALTEAGPGGIDIELALHDRPLILTLTADEAERLRDALGDMPLPKAATA